MNINANAAMRLCQPLDEERTLFAAYADMEAAASLIRQAAANNESPAAIAQALEAIAKRATEAAQAIWREQGQRLDAAATPGAQWGGTSHE